MRPRVFPAEDRVVRNDSAHGVPLASMRPRVFPAEDRDRFVTSILIDARFRFNEAAGIPRGRPHGACGR